MTAVDTERFRLRRYVDRLVQMGECEVHDKPIDMVDVAAKLDGNPKAVLFRSAGPEKAELVGNVMGSRKRLAMALDTDETGLLAELNKRLAQPIAPVEIAAKDAPVPQVVLRDNEADLCPLPAHLSAREGRPVQLSPPSLDLCPLSLRVITKVGLPPPSVWGGPAHRPGIQPESPPKRTLGVQTINGKPVAPPKGTPLPRWPLRWLGHPTPGPNSQWNPKFFRIFSRASQ